MASRRYVGRIGLRGEVDPGSVRVSRVGRSRTGRCRVSSARGLLGGIFPDRVPVTQHFVRTLAALADQRRRMPRKRRPAIQVHRTVLPVAAGTTSSSRSQLKATWWGDKNMRSLLPCFRCFFVVGELYLNDLQFSTQKSEKMLVVAGLGPTGSLRVCRMANGCDSTFHAAASNSPRSTALDGRRDRGPGRPRSWAPRPSP